MKIDLTMLKGKLLDLAKIADEKAGAQNGVYLDNDKEISLFMEEAQKAVQRGEIEEDDVNKIFGFEKTAQAESKQDDAEFVKKYLEELSREEREKVTNLTRTNTDSELLEISHNLDSMLIENEITGLGALLNRLPQYDLNKLAERYLDLENKYNEVQEEVENWYNSPDAEPVPVETKALFEETAESILGMPYQEFASKYEAELEVVAKIPPIIRGVSPISQIILHEQAVAKLTDEEREVFKKISSLNSVLAVDFTAWENDIRYRANDLTSEMTMDVIENLDIVASNEYADDSTFEMPENWLVKKNFLEAIDETGDPATGLEDVSADKDTMPKTRKIIKNNNILIEKTNNDGSKEYYDLSGRKIQQE